MLSDTKTTAEENALLDAPARRPRLFPAVLLSALLMTLAFPPVDAGWIAWIALAPLFAALLHARRPRHAFALGYLFGLTHWGATILWIGTTVVNWCHSPIGWVAWIVLTAIKSGWFGLFGVLAWWIGRRTLAHRQGHVRALAVAAAWTVVEWLRGQGSVAMPWSLSGYTQYRYLPLIQIADLAGVYAVGFGIALVNATLVESLRVSGVQIFRRSGVQESRRQLTPSPLHPFTPSVLYLAILLLYGAFALNRSYDDGTPVRLALMQPNIASRSDQPGSKARDLALYRSLTAEAAPHRPFLVVWPESAADDAAADPDTRAAFAELARRSGAYQLVGTGFKDAQDRIYNSAALFAPDGRLIDRYDKHWLVPMGEWVPARRWIPFASVFHFPEETTPGTAEKVLAAGQIRMCALICYESVFPILSRTRVAAGANLLVSITNDSWAGQSPELQQHIAMAALRAIETRRWLASAATTGITCLIAPTGRIRALPPYQPGSLVGDVRLRSGLPPYVAGGDGFVGACALGLTLVLWRGKTEPQRRRDTEKDQEPGE